MHYSKTSFSENGRETITPKIANSQIRERSQGFSALDLLKLNKYYNCPGKIFGIFSFNNISFGSFIDTDYRKNLTQQSLGRKRDISD